MELTSVMPWVPSELVKLVLRTLFEDTIGLAYATGTAFVQTLQAASFVVEDYNLN
jgi:hypothetical protein